MITNEQKFLLMIMKFAGVKNYNDSIAATYYGNMEHHERFEIATTLPNAST